MDSLPEGSVVICMGGTVRLMSQCELSSSEELSAFREIARPDLS